MLVYGSALNSFRKLCFEHNTFNVHLVGIGKILAHSNVRGTFGSRIIITMHH